MNIENDTSKIDELRQLATQWNNGQISRSEYNRLVIAAGPVTNLEKIGANLQREEINNQAKSMLNVGKKIVHGFMGWFSH